MLPIPDPIPEDPFYHQPAAVEVPTIVNFSPPVDLGNKVSEERVEKTKAVDETPPPVIEVELPEKSDTNVEEASSIHDLLTSHPEDEGPAETSNEEITDTSPVPVYPEKLGAEIDIDNPPSLLLDINFNISPTDGNGNIEEDFGEFSEVNKVDEEIINNELIEESPWKEEEEEEKPTSPIVSISKDTLPDAVVDVPSVTETADIPDDFGDFIENPATNSNIDLVVAEETKANVENCDLFFHPPTPKDDEKSAVIATDDQDDDFDDFTDFSSSVPVEARKASVDVPAEPSIAEFEADFNQFANFENFSQPTEVVTTTTVDDPVSVAQEAIVKQSSSLPLENFSLDDKDPVEEEDDDDDFGDFTSSVVVAPPAAAPVIVEEHQLPAIDISNVDVVLSEIFPSTTAIESVTEGLQSTTAKMLLEMGDYETTALTEEYQWCKSTSHKCLVKCLGIDTRNIVRK